MKAENEIPSVGLKTDIIRTLHRCSIISEVEGGDNIKRVFETEAEEIIKIIDLHLTKQAGFIVDSAFSEEENIEVVTKQSILTASQQYQQSIK